MGEMTAITKTEMKETETTIITKEQIKNRIAKLEAEKVKLESWLAEMAAK